MGYPRRPWSYVWVGKVPNDELDTAARYSVLIPTAEAPRFRASSKQANATGAATVDCKRSAAANIVGWERIKLA